ncbi:MAG: ABC transporter substrate-binding protein [Akkermansiaceae bacterium]|nr:ABC transporter substrate-binding protein [Akkermansiaceae bacterium]
MTVQNSRRLLLAGFVASLAMATTAQAQKRYDTGATDTEIKIGNIHPYSGPASAYGTIAKAAGAYFTKVNTEGGINGRKINFISYDDAYSPAKTVEQARKLVEQDEVLAIFLPLGTSQNLAIQKYMNAKKVPQLFVATGATRWGNIQENPWTIGWQPTYQSEARAYAQHILKNSPNAKIAVLMQNDDFGKDYQKGLLDGLGDKAKSMIVTTQTYETSDPTIDSQIVTMKGTGADTLIILATPKFAAMAIKKAAEVNWTPARYLSNVSNSVGSVLKPAGLDASKGLYSANYLRDPTDPAVQTTKEYQDFSAFMKRYYPGGDSTDVLNLIGYSSAQTLVQTIKQAGDNLTRENLMKQALSLNMTLPMLYPGINVSTSASNAYPVEQWQMIQFNGTRYESTGGILGGGR